MLNEFLKYIVSLDPINKELAEMYLTHINNIDPTMWERFDSLDDIIGSLTEYVRN